MVTIASGKASTENLLGRQRALDDTQRTFLAKASSLGVQASPLVLGKPTRVLPSNRGLACPPRELAFAKKVRWVSSIRTYRLL